MQIRSRTVAAGICLSVLALGLSPANAVTASSPEHRKPQPVPAEPAKHPTAVGHGGAVASVDPEATKVGLDVLRRGGNAVDAAIATAAALGVTEPYSAGIGGGGYLMHYDARTKRITTIDGRETAPAGVTPQAFVNPATGKTYPFTPDLVTSGASVGVPGTPMLWKDALERWGTRSLRQSLEPAARLAERGFVVDETFRSQTLDNKERFEAFPATSRLFLSDGDAPKVGTVFRNPDLARTYRQLGRQGVERAFYRGPLAKQMSDVVQRPRTSADTTLPVPAGTLTPQDLAGYRTTVGKGTTSHYRGYTVHGMDGSSSGGTTVGEALNILDQFDLSSMSGAEAQHHYLAATALAFADRGLYVGDPAFVEVPVKGLLSKGFAAQRACQIEPGKALKTPAEAGDMNSTEPCGGQAEVGRHSDTENEETTNLTTADRWGNVVEYTLTIEQTGGSGQVVPGRGFLLNNELTDFSIEYDPVDPNRIEPGKRPRSSMAPTIITRDGKPVLALGSPGGSTIISTVLQTVVNRIDLGMQLPQAVAAPRATLRNTEKVTAEPDYIEQHGAAVGEIGYLLQPAGDAFTSQAEIGALTAIEFGPRGRMTAAAEPTRRGGGAAAVLHPNRR
ncbi:gamma-glutamyltransferase [Luteococcus sp. OSA5]|uniref:gamma-glutamyltransferase n=1 Tax=Luteococcus sp. OSA5 TaxID=3401630 RepID=UPI003B42813D